MSGFQIAVDGVKEPERRIGGMIQPLFLSLREHVGDQAIADVMCKRAKNVGSFHIPAGCERQPFQANHGVAAPVREPGITGNDGPHFVPGGLGSGGVLQASSRADNKLIRGQD